MQKTAGRYQAQRSEDGLGITYRCPQCDKVSHYYFFQGDSIKPCKRCSYQPDNDEITREVLGR